MPILTKYQNPNPIDFTADKNLVSNYLDAILNNRTPTYVNLLQNSSRYPKTPIAKATTNIREIQSVMINAVQASKLKEFFPSTTLDSPSLKGIKILKPGFFWGSDLDCEGNYFFDGVVVLNNPTITTNKECSIYATRTIFLHSQAKRNQNNDGVIFISDQNAQPNLQLMSATNVVLG